MKKIIFIALACFPMLFQSCMDQHDIPEDYVYGTTNISESNITIADLKSQYNSVIDASKAPEKIETPTVIEGVVVGTDESGNLYKQLVVRDATGSIIVGINTTGLYSYFPAGQKVRINCQGLYIGGYAKLAQIGDLYEGGIGRMSEQTWKEHVMLIDKPNLNYNELIPMDIDEAFLKDDANKGLTPIYVKLSNVQFTEAGNNTLYAPEDGPLTGSEVNRTLKVGKTDLIFRVSPYANFANDTIPTGQVNITGILTRFNNDWQLKAVTSKDIEIIDNKNN